MSRALISHLLALAKHSGQAPRDQFPSSTLTNLPSPLKITPLFIHMSDTHPTVPSSRNFQLIFSNALKAYEKHTKNDLLSHPLAAQLQACQSPGSILTVLQLQVQDLDESRTSNEWLTKWLDPTINVLYAFSETIGEGVSLVRLVI